MMHCVEVYTIMGYGLCCIARNSMTQPYLSSLQYKTTTPKPDFQIAHKILEN